MTAQVDPESLAKELTKVLPPGAAEAGNMPVLLPLVKAITMATELEGQPSAAEMLHALLVDAVGGYTPPLGRLPKLPEGEAWWLELPQPEPEEVEEDAAEVEAQMQAALQRERGFGQAQAEAAASAAQAKAGEGEEASELDPAMLAIIANMRAAKLQAPAQASPAGSAAGGGGISAFFGSAKALQRG